MFRFKYWKARMPFFLDVFNDVKVAFCHREIVGWCPVF